MTKEEFGQPFTAYLISMQAPFDKHQNAAYYRVLKDVPANIYHMVIEELMNSNRRFVPRAGEIKALCEQKRKALIAEHPFVACVSCAGGWRTISESDGYEYVKRCACWEAHWARLESLGVPAKPVAMLTEASDEAQG